MELRRLLSGDPSKSSKLYLAIGAISLVKAIAVRNDRNRFRRELLDAGLFIGVGIALRKYSQVKAEKRTELESQLPDWMADLVGSGSGSGSPSQGLQTLAKRRLQGQSESESDPSLRDRARGFVSS